MAFVFGKGLPYVIIHPEGIFGIIEGFDGFYETKCEKLYSVH